MVNIISERVRDNIIYNHRIYNEPLTEHMKIESHVHNECEIIFFVGGNATYVIEDRKYVLKKNDLILVRPSRYHYIEFDGNENYERYNLLFPTSFVGKELLARFPTDTEVICCDENPTVMDIFAKMDSYNEFGEDAFIDLFPGLMKELFYNIIHSLGNIVSTPTRISPLITNALSYINNNLYTIENISEIANHLFVTEIYFFRVFKDQMKISPKKYITNKRLVAAQKKIKKGAKPTEVYLECGFNTYTAFYKRYVAYFGFSPSDT